MTPQHLPRLLAAAVVVAGAVGGASAVPTASAAQCPDVELVFARGTGEVPGVGGVGQSYVDALRAQLGARTLEVYPVNYAASSDFDDREAFAGTVINGVNDAGARVQATAAKCPATRIVLGGYSQGAVVAGYVTADHAPAGVPASVVPAPLPASVADHVAAVTLFGTPSHESLMESGAPDLVIGPSYASKLLELCAPGDGICDGTPNGQPDLAHLSYGANGMTEQAASYVEDRIASAPVGG